jgi:hypothetical protein
MAQAGGSVVSVESDEVVIDAPRFAPTTTMTIGITIVSTDADARIGPRGTTTLVARSLDELERGEVTVSGCASHPFRRVHTVTVGT